ncbi:glycoside hydrolase family 64 protein [Cellulomonas fimi]|uniref:Glucan endo-1,3-beta-D-glucosidase n=1 Tax=Cellulomonas fimi (strain ATCC 484 / DSM 20113 / JCM 1341 / CCUG 24087 / LMG 16345 / NBRC 15513 / NCIMB 8980 / NCTC 7547 / NRS-133) TaxID=590998 RepID=F4H174_CELFA|nr:beta-1,3-glucanase family protein [Cellulomonas fimi]AEE47443.1 Glucan endo-1,3-beta-D-glucosidase [Cellulomonas fimi ATCC 484]NNH05579.1 glucan endo-1,3-beta-D-glucosidase [Cellulomonas fimi]VEH36237.1 Glucan endo-1,3-beta-glucosidase precursor [Cellulomonas fimi]
MRIGTPRALLGILAAAALAVPLVLTGTTAAQAVGPSVLPVTVTNSTGRGDTVHLYVLGTDLATGRLGYVNAAGTFTPWPAGSNPPSPAPDVSIAGPANGGTKTINVPRGFSGRVYFSMGAKLPFFLTPDGLVQPAPWAGGDASHDVLFDWSELTYNDSGLWLNSSQVDMFAIPHAVTVTGASGVTRRTGDVVANGRDQVIDALKAQPGWSGSVVTRADGTVLRVLAPGKAAAAGLLSTTYLDPYITSAWNAYTTRTLTVTPFSDQPSLRYYGRTSGDVMRFTNASGAQVASFSKPSSADVWGCDGALHAPNDQVVGPIARTLCAALNRGTLGTVDTQPSTNAAEFYRSSPTNQYAKAIHAAMADGKAYAFAFDDVGAFESLVHDGDPRSAGLVLSPFTGGGTGGGGGGGGGATAGALVNANGMCLDNDNRGTTNGNKIQIWGCNGTVAQQWSFVEAGSTLRVQGKCLDIAGGGTANGTKVQLWDCNSTGAQVWVPQTGGAYRNPQSGRCLDIPSGSSTAGTQVQIYDCNGTGAQRWTLR